MSESVRNAQIKTFRIAREITGDFRCATPYAACMSPPYCLRLLKPFRTPETQAFRDMVAYIAWTERKL